MLVDLSEIIQQQRLEHLQQVRIPVKTIRQSGSCRSTCPEHGDHEKTAATLDGQSYRYCPSAASGECNFRIDSPFSVKRYAL